MRIGVIGAAGRMGLLLIREVSATAGLELAGAVVRSGHAALGRDCGMAAGIDANGVAFTDDMAALFSRTDCVIDFSHAAVATQSAGLAAAHRTALVLGTTGLNAAAQGEIARAATQTAIVQAANTSLGIAVVEAIVEQVARALKSFDVDILDLHHRTKRDAPSGTALLLGEAVARGLGCDLSQCRTESGLPGPRGEGAIGFASLRCGDIVGEHSVVFAGTGERIEIIHRSTDRRLFAAGAVRAALWTEARVPGLYGMRDVLGL